MELGLNAGLAYYNNLKPFKSKIALQISRHLLIAGAAYWSIDVTALQKCDLLFIFVLRSITIFTWYTAQGELNFNFKKN